MVSDVFRDPPGDMISQLNVPIHSIQYSIDRQPHHFAATYRKLSRIAQVFAIYKLNNTSVLVAKIVLHVRLTLSLNGNPGPICGTAAYTSILGVEVHVNLCERTVL
jgi:hypothetical protein